MQRKKETVKEKHVKTLFSNTKSAEIVPLSENKSTNWNFDISSVISEERTADRINSPVFDPFAFDVLVSEFFEENNDVAEESNTPLYDKETGNNLIVTGKMCYNCSYTITEANIGIRCNKCIREYHISCISKLGLSYLPNFICSVCTKKLTKI